MSHINFELVINREELTNIAIDVVLDVGVVCPYDGIDTVRQFLQKQPEAQEGESEVPSLPNEACA